MREGKYLAVSRRNDPTNWGLLGGKVDQGETPAEAIVREVFEESGFHISLKDIGSPLFTSVCEGDVTFQVTTFGFFEDAPLLVDLYPEAGLTLAYVDATTLTNEATSPFASYNKALLNLLPFID